MKGKTEGRPMYTRGPIIFALEVAQVVTGFIAIVAIGLSIWQFETRIDTNSHRINDIQHARYESSIDTCYAIRSLTLHAFTPKHRHAALRVLSETGLGNCVANARRITNEDRP